jgi:uncharacterized protein with HEPN domain
MLSDRARTALGEILRNIDLAEQFTRDIPVEQFVTDDLRLYATIRVLEIVSEASRRVPEEIKARHPEVPWRQIAAAGNIYRHGYDVVVPEVIWETAQTGFTALRSAVEAELAGSG